MTDCYCRGAGVCDRNHHICDGCTCNHDGAPQTQETVTAGHVNPSRERMAAWQEKQELTR